MVWEAINSICYKAPVLSVHTQCESVISTMPDVMHNALLVLEYTMTSKLVYIGTTSAIGFKMD